MLGALPAVPALAGSVVVVAPMGPLDPVFSAFSAGLGGRVPDSEIVRVDRVDPVDGGSADLVVTLGEDGLRSASGVDAPMLAGLISRTAELDRSAVPAVVTDVSGASWVALVHDLLPDAQRIGVIVSNDQNQRRAVELAAAAKGLGLEVKARRVTAPRDLPAALAELSREIDVLVGFPDDVVFSAATAKAVLLFSFRNRIPLVGPNEKWVDAGALFSPVVDPAGIGAQCAEVAAALLAGEPTQRITAPAHVGYVVNPRSAEQLGVVWASGVLEGSSGGPGGARVGP